jgi:hypothetical protein
MAKLTLSSAVEEFMIRWATKVFAGITQSFTPKAGQPYKEVRNVMNYR